MKRTLVRPVNDIASAAENYIKDRREGRRGRTYFDFERKAHEKVCNLYKGV